MENLEALMIGTNLGLSIISLLISVGALIVSMISVAKVKGFENSTHQVQYVPIDLPEDEDDPATKHLAKLDKDPLNYDARDYDDYVKEVQKKKAEWKEKIEKFYDMNDDSIL